MIINTIVVIVLSSLAVIDIRKRSLPLYLVLASVAFAAFAGWSAGTEYGVFDVAAMLLLILGLYFTSIGRADVFIVLAILLIKGFWDGIVIVWLGFLFCGFFGLGLMLGKKATRLTWLPLIPFLDLAYIFFWVWGIG